MRCILTKAATQFVTPYQLPLSLARKFTVIYFPPDESEMGHTQLSRDADLLVVCPTVNILAQMAHGICDDLATTALLATDKPVMTVPAMNVKMWQNPATSANTELLRARGYSSGPIDGDMACGEFGPDGWSNQNFLSCDL